MMLEQAVCPKCGGKIMVDSDEDAAICEYCGQPFIVQNAINDWASTFKTMSRERTKRRKIALDQRKMDLDANNSPGNTALMIVTVIASTIIFVVAMYFMYMSGMLSS